jgi:CMP-N,N'-diacetyllegionaminic acid synthase
MSEESSMILGVVPARGGSKGVPGKNIRPLQGKPLIVYTLEAACNSGVLARTIVTTDSKEIEEIVLRHGFECPFLRPSGLACDDIPLIFAVKHALAFMEGNGKKYSTVCLLQPTSPFRTARHIQTAVKKYQESDCDTLVSVVNVPHRFVPKSLMVQKGEYLENYQGGDVSVSRHQDEHLLARNGPAILISDAELIRNGTFYGNRLVGFPMDLISSVDIDEEDDWRLAERIACND